MRKARKVETRRDRKALATDAGLGRVSVVSSLAGALTAAAGMAALLTIAAAIAVGINRGRDFSTMSVSGFKVAIGLVVAVAAFLSFILGGYTAGRMSRRGGASNGLVAGILGVILGVVVVALLVVTGADAGLARVAAHINAPSTWSEWRPLGSVTAIVTVAAMVFGGLAGGIKGERWHGKLLARAVDSAYGPEAAQAEELAALRRQAAEAERARMAAEERIARRQAAPATSPSSATAKAAARNAARKSAGEPDVAPLARHDGEDGRRHLMHR